MSDKAFLIVLDRATADQLNAAHELVKQKTDKWWHRYEAVWVVLGGNAGEWRDSLKPLMPSGGATVMVFELPRDVDNRWWAAFGPAAHEKFAWLRDEYKKPAG